MKNSNGRKKIKKKMKISISKVKVKVRGVVSSKIIDTKGVLTSLKCGNLEGALYMRSVPRPLVAGPQVLRQYPGKIILGSKNIRHICKYTKRTTIMGPLTRKGWYRVVRLPRKCTDREVEANINALTAALQLKREKVQRFHAQCGHAPTNILRLILAEKSIYGLVPKDVDLLQTCKDCGFGKPRRASHPTKDKKVGIAFGTHLSSDNTAEQPVQSKGGKKVINVTIDEYSNWVWTAAMRSKSCSVARLRYILEQDLKNKTVILRTDQGGEFVNYELGELMQRVGAVHNTSGSGTSKQNGKAEKAIQDIVRGLRTCLRKPGLGLSLWAECLIYYTFIKNRLPCYANPDMKSPYEMRYGRVPEYKRFREWGVPCVAMYPKKKAPLKKLGDQGIEGIFVGYDDADGTMQYRVYVPTKNKIYKAPDVTFMDEVPGTGTTPDVEKIVGTPGSLSNDEAAEDMQDAEAKTQHKNDNDTMTKADAVTKLEESAAKTPKAKIRMPKSILKTPNTKQTIRFKAQRKLTFGNTTTTAGRNEAKTPRPKAMTLKPKPKTPKVKAKKLRPKIMTPKQTKTPKPFHSTDTSQISDEMAKPNTPKPEPEPPPPAPRRGSRHREVKNYKKYNDTGDLNSLGCGIGCGSGGAVPPEHFHASVNYARIEAYVNEAITTIKSKQKVTELLTPLTIEAALSGLNAEDWTKATKKEIQALLDNKVFKIVRIKDLPLGTKIISGKWVFKLKPAADGRVAVFKARIVARDFEARAGIYFDKTFSPVAQVTTVKLLLAIAAKRGLHLRVIDFKTAFLNALRKLTNKTVYFKPPPGAPCPPGCVWLLQRALYGLPDSPLLWHQTLKRELLAAGYTQSSSDPCLFYRFKRGEYTLLSLTVDDVLVASKKKAHAERLIAKLRKKFKLKDLGCPEYVLGLHVQFDRKDHTLKLNQRLYFEILADKYGQTDAKPVYNPADTNSHLSADMDSPLTDEDYRGLVGSLIYGVHTRPDGCRGASLQLVQVSKCPTRSTLESCASRSSFPIHHSFHVSAI